VVKVANVGVGVVIGLFVDVVIDGNGDVDLDDLP
jgi:hypothetical protein